MHWAGPSMSVLCLQLEQPATARHNGAEANSSHLLCGGNSSNQPRNKPLCKAEHVLVTTQDVSSGKPVQVGDTDLWGMEIDVAAAAEEIRSIGKADKGKSIDDVLGSFGLGAFADQLKDLKLSKPWPVCIPMPCRTLCESKLVSVGCKAQRWGL